MQSHMTRSQMPTLSRGLARPRVAAHAARRHSVSTSTKPFAPFFAKGLHAPRPAPPTGRPTRLQVASPSLTITTDAPAAEPTTSAGTEQEQFVWTKQWYVVFPLEYLDPKKPNAFTLLGKDMVLWQDAQGEWRCFEDRCPHRLVPLSEGWVNGNTLECAYHGWRFQGDGACTSIPSMPDAAAHATATASKKSCVKSYPVQVCATGLVWVWPEAGPVAWVESAATAPRLIPDLETEDCTPAAGRWYMRDMPHDWEFFIENVIDPAHVAFAHHGFPGINREKAGAIDMRVVEKATAQGGFKSSVGTAANTENGSEFRPPCLVVITTGVPSGGFQYLVLYATPIRKGWVRHIGVTYLKGTKQARLLSVFTGSTLPAWLGHYFASDFLHGDLVLLHPANRTLEAEGRQWQKSYYIPTPADVGVANFWNWINQFAGGTVPYPPGQDALPPPITREELLDRYNQHTKHCPHCRTALANTNKLQAAARAAACLLLGVAITAAWAAARAAAAAAATATATATAAPVGQLVAAVAAINPVPVLVLAGVLAAAVQLLERFKKGFYYLPFVRPA